ncbi:glycoside hydrolase family 16 protein [Coniophora puteana RWD-64-598 SS2]|uniref:Glycoside hydrolase family 16 protein n=1 Tax=Coniophora puteana (strain RWD-64-598) TaxID=741705 RepID=A0A5M3MZJ2_CONPW|nr:glycoside hydrolase family 16 protein [Coniophora puteana RWD-64-598 SS2]EIW84558.1 glycoside hydrolase family 16 protein [Coniophora puteana RWD-64-598 SS2]
MAFAAPDHTFEKRDGNYETLSNGSTVIWVIDDVYQGSTFFDAFGFYTGPDPTHFLDANDSFSSGLAYVQDDGKVIMKGDDTTQLAYGANRNSVRISSYKQYNGGLFILDVDRAPWGCGVWPAWWTLGDGTWPYTGEIDIIEGVHANEHNQVTWHTAPGCNVTQPNTFSGTIGVMDNWSCDATNGQGGCGIIEWSRSSYGPYFDSIGGGVFAMKWNADGISVWSFYRSAVPADIVSGEPNPSGWGEPVAALSSEGCELSNYFMNHSIIFDITFCGDWAGNSYATSGCPGTCQQQIMDPANFVNASWIINWMKVYKEEMISGNASNAAPRRLATSLVFESRWTWVLGALSSVAWFVL